MVSISASDAFSLNGKIWIPEDAVDLQLALLTIAHCGAMGHRGVIATRTGLMEIFTWRGIAKDVETFVGNCLQCMCLGAGFIPRPLGEALHAVEPNKLIHCDFLSMPGGYIHVIVDDASRFCLLTAHDDCKTVDAVESLQHWFGIFGIVEWWVSDQGPHYKNEVISTLKSIYGTGHHFTPAYCPWANGTVEVLMRSINKTFKTLLVELKQPMQQWRPLRDLVQHCLNQTPSSRNNGIAPITAMTQLAPSNALSAFLVDEKIISIDPNKLEKWRAYVLQELANARDQLHRDISSAVDAKRDVERERRNDKPIRRQKPGRRSIQFAVGDYVLVGKVSQTFAKKLQVQWLGPRRILEALSDWVFLVEDLRDSSRTVHHASRLKFFAAVDFNMTQDLLDHIAYVEGGYLVEALIDCKFDRTSKQWLIQVKWMGLDTIENSWEPLDILLEDVPKLVHAFVEKNSVSNSNVSKMKADIPLLAKKKN